jgi:hypothetical protein
MANRKKVEDAPTKEVAIIGNGFYVEEREWELYDKPEIKKWIMTKKAMKLIESGAMLVNFDIFEIHKLEQLPEKTRTFLERYQDTVIMQKEYSQVKGSICYPIDDIILKLKTRYFTVSMSYMMALAIRLGYEKIYIRGINMLLGHGIQKYSLEYFLGMCNPYQGPKIKVDISDRCDLLKCQLLYGFEACNLPGVEHANAVAAVKLEIEKILNSMLGVAAVKLEIEKIHNLLQILDNKEAALMDEIAARQGIHPDTWDPNNPNDWEE